MKIIGDECAYDMEFFGKRAASCNRELIDDVEESDIYACGYADAVMDLRDAIRLARAVETLTDARREFFVGLPVGGPGSKYAIRLFAPISRDGEDEWTYGDSLLDALEQAAAAVKETTA